MTRPAPKITQRQALAALWGYGEPGDWIPVQRLARETGQPTKVALRKIESLVDKGLADYGVAPHYAWRTPEGEAKLRELTGA